VKKHECEKNTFRQERRKWKDTAAGGQARFAKDFQENQQGAKVQRDIIRVVGLSVPTSKIHQENNDG
jgi:hypothetical protein